MLVEYGTAYDRTTDTISGGGTATAACTQNTTCDALANLTRGLTYFWRWKERDDSDTVLLAGRVESLAVR